MLQFACFIVHSSATCIKKFGSMYLCYAFIHHSYLQVALDEQQRVINTAILATNIR